MSSIILNLNKQNVMKKNEMVKKQIAYEWLLTSHKSYIKPFVIHCAMIREYIIEIVYNRDSIYSEFKKKPR